MKISRLTWISLTLSLMIGFIFSCQKREIADASEDIAALHALPKGVVTGKIFANNGTTPIAHASVFVDISGEVFYTYSAKNGEFSLEVPQGTHTLHIQTGGGRIFRTELEVEVFPRKTTNITDPDVNGGGGIALRQAGNLAYIKGAYDAIEDIIIDSLGYSATELTVNDLNNLNTMQQYAAIFLNCGKSGTMDSVKYHNIESYVMTGGSIYASDYAVNYLTGDGNYRLKPRGGTSYSGGKGDGVEPHEGHEHSKSGHCSTPVGGFIPDNELCTQKSGTATTLSNVNILAQDIENALGKSTLDIVYNIGAWEVIEHWNQWEVLMEDNGGYGPLALRRNFSSNNIGGNNISGNEDKVTICHIPPGNPANPQTITISNNGLQAHLNHGCHVGTCSGQGGNIYYTTFHNKPQGGLSKDVQDILEYFILNL